MILFDVVRGVLWDILAGKQRDGQPVGKTSGRADRLEPGEELNLQAPLPSQAESMQVYSLQWRTGDVGRLLGPWAPWPFGYLQYDPSA